MTVALRKLSVALGIVLLAIADSRGQGDSFTDSPTNAPLAGLEQSAFKLGLEEDLPARLGKLIWPGSGGKDRKWTVKKMSMPGKRKGEDRNFFIRPDNHDLILLRRVESKPDSGSRVRQEFYYRTTARGGLALALTVTFQFTIDDVDNELLKKVTCETYGQTTGDGSKPIPISPDVEAQFGAEKKFWLAQEKKLRKQEHSLKK